MVNLEQLSFQIAKFLRELQSIDITDGPLGGSHNYYRGAHVSVYDQDARTYMLKISIILQQSCKNSSLIIKLLYGKAVLL